MAPSSMVISDQGCPCVTPDMKTALAMKYFTLHVYSEHAGLAVPQELAQDITVQCLVCQYATPEFPLSIVMEHIELHCGYNQQGTYTMAPKEVAIQPLQG